MSNQLCQLGLAKLSRAWKEMRCKCKSQDKEALTKCSPCIPRPALMFLQCREAFPKVLWERGGQHVGNRKHTGPGKALVSWSFQVLFAELYWTFSGDLMTFDRQKESASREVFTRGLLISSTLYSGYGLIRLIRSKMLIIVSKCA